MTKPLSVVIPAYNCKNTILDCLNSITNKEINFIKEIVIVNDNSNDDSKDIIEEFSKKFNHIKLLNNSKNYGGGYSRNKGIDECNNNLIYILDSDNYVDVSSLKKIFEYAFRHNIATHYETSKYFSKINNIQETYNFMEIFGEEVTYEKILSNNGIFTDNGIIRKDIWKKANGYPENHHWDTQGFSVRYLQKANIKLIKDTFYYHRRFTNKPSYYERQEISGNNFTNAYLVYEEIFTDINKRNIFKEEFFSKLASNNFFLNKKINEIFHEDIKINNTKLDNKKTKKYYEIFFSAIEELNNGKLYDAKKILLDNTKKNIEYLNDLLLFNLIKIYRKENKIFKDNFFFRKDVFNIVIILRIISSTNFKLKFIIFYLRYIIAFSYYIIKNYISKNLVK